MRKSFKTIVAFAVVLSIALGGVSYAFAVDTASSDANAPNVTASAEATTEATTEEATTRAAATTEKPVKKKVTSVPTVIKRVMNAGSKKIKIAWIPKGNVDGYQIRYVNGKTVKKVLVKGRTSNNITIKKLKKKKTYKVSVRTYTLDKKKKVYSSWSAAKKIKVK